MKKFLFLMILILVTCFTVMLSALSLRNGNTQAEIVKTKGPVVWVFSTLSKIRPLVLHR